jgi:thioredoxin
MKSLTGLILIVLIAASMSVNAQEESKIKPELLTEETFKQKVFNYEKNTEEWIFEGDKPAIIDFYADWCRPCRLVAPIMDELANEYKDQIYVYKVDTEKQRELSRIFGIRSIPAVLFVPMNGKPQMSTGALPKESYKQVIDEFLLGNKKDQ